MRLIIFLSILLFLTSCDEKSDCMNLIFDENDFVLLETKKDDLGKKYSDLLRSNSTPDLLLKKIYWENGLVQSSVFFTQRGKIGPAKYYSRLGEMLYHGFYYNDKQAGIEIIYNPEAKTSTIKMYKSGIKINELEAD